MQTDLKALRKDAGDLSQQDAAALVGVSPATFSRWERGVTKPRRSAIEALQRRARHADVGDIVRVPILGHIPAGPLDLAREEVIGWEDVQRWGASDVLFILVVKGQSMESQRIFDGDLVVVRQQETAESGEIVVARIDDEATLKRLRYRHGVPYLEGDQGPIYPSRPQDLRILGEVLEVRRRLKPRG